MILILILCILSLVYGLFKYKNLHNPCSIFFLIWGILSFLSSFGFYGANTPNQNTYIIIFIGLFSFLMGSILVGYIKINTSLSDSNEEFSINYKLIIILHFITIVFLIYQSITVITLLRNGFTLKNIRYMSTDTGYNMLRSSNFIVLVQNFIVTPTVYLSIAVVPIDIFKGNRSKLLFISTLFITVLWVLTTGGRSIILWFTIYFFYLIRFYGKKIKLKKWMKLLIISLSFILTIFFIVTTKSRKGSNVDFLYQAYLYFVVPIIHFEYRLDYISYYYSNTYGYGIASFYGFLYPFIFILQFFGINVPLFSQMRELSFTILENPIFVGNNITMNAFVTFFYQFYLDGGMLGVCIGSFIFGGFSIYAYKKAVLSNKGKWVLIYLLILQKLIFSFVRFYFTQPVQAVCMIMALFVYKRAKHQSFTTSGILIKKSN